MQYIQNFYFCSKIQKENYQLYLFFNHDSDKYKICIKLIQNELLYQKPYEIDTKELTDIKLTKDVIEEIFKDKNFDKNSFEKSDYDYVRKNGQHDVQFDTLRMFKIQFPNDVNNFYKIMKHYYPNLKLQYKIDALIEQGRILYKDDKFFSIYISLLVFYYCEENYRQTIFNEDIIYKALYYNLFSVRYINELFNSGHNYNRDSYNCYIENSYMKIHFLFDDEEDSVAGSQQYYIDITNLKDNKKYVIYDWGYAHGDAFEYYFSENSDLSESSE